MKQAKDGSRNSEFVMPGLTRHDKPDVWNSLSFNAEGLIPAIIQDVADGTVLMMAWMNAESLRLSLTTGQTWFWSRSRKRLWHKGEESGNTQEIQEAYYDCDGDTLLLKVVQGGAGVACHTGQRSCFHNVLTFDAEERN
ncbi:MAG: phosphoribosyl-AMP cyclohydrolase [Actinomycetes bacterium]|jgi:phosphoribosyl-AMP cyclohydrolase|nr:phosphoribosyl-AMP cyclohydrolase [Actinomycetes bacterium]